MGGCCDSSNQEEKEEKKETVKIPEFKIEIEDEDKKLKEDFWRVKTYADTLANRLMITDYIDDEDELAFNKLEQSSYIIGNSLDKVKVAKYNFQASKGNFGPMEADKKF